MSEPQTTPLCEEHEKLHAKMVNFAGWYMPVEYAGLRQEHLNTRQNVGLFDVSHMGELRFLGPNSLTTLQWLTSNDVSRLGPGQAQYSLLTNEQGGVVDDIIVYCLEPNKDYFVCVNAANVDKDHAWVVKHNKGAEIRNESAAWGQIAVQGPKALALLKDIFSASDVDGPAFHFSRPQWRGRELIFARTGYTGERGAEIFVPKELTAELWRELLAKGEKYGVQPVGLGARDTLRTEMKYSLYGHEIDDTTNPYAAGLGWVVKPDKKDFLGREAILAQKNQGLKRKLIGFIMTERGIPRAGYKIFSFEDQEIGHVTSGTVSPSLNDNIGIGYVDASFCEIGSFFNIDIRGRRIQAKVVETPFVKLKES